MIRARLNSGQFIVGIDAENVRRLKAGEPINLDLRPLGGTDHVYLMYGETLEAIKRELEEAQGHPLPPESTELRRRHD